MLVRTWNQILHCYLECERHCRGCHQGPALPQGFHSADMNAYTHLQPHYHSSQALDTAQMPINSRMDSMWYIHVTNEDITCAYEWISVTTLNAIHRGAHRCDNTYTEQEQFENQPMEFRDSRYLVGRRRAGTRSKNQEHLLGTGL